MKAWHYHQQQVDNFACVAGMVKLVLVDTRPDSPTNGAVNEFFIGMQNPMLVQVPNLVYHGWKCISPDMALVINVPTEPYRYAEPDEYRLGAARHAAVRLDPQGWLTSSSPAAPASSAATSSATRSRTHADWRVTTLDKLTYAGRRENLHDVMDAPAPRVRARRHRGRVGQRPARRALRDRRALRGRDARRPLDSWPPATSSAPTSKARSCCSRPPAAPRDCGGSCRSRPTRCTAASPTGASAETDELKPRNPVRGEQGRRGPARLQLLGHLRRAGDRHARVEQLRPVSVPGEGHPALRDQRHRRHPRAAVRRRQERPRLAARRRPLPRARPAHRDAASTARSTTSAAATRS